MIKIIKGDLIELALNGDFDVIGHGCNCFSRMKRGIAPQMAAAFGCDEFRLEKEIMYEWDKLGRIDFEGKRLYNLKLPAFIKNSITYAEFEKSEEILYIVNMYTQYHWEEKDPVYNIPLNYTALDLCLQKMDKVFAGKKIGIPWIGCGLAGGDKTKVESIIQYRLINCEVTIVEYNKE